MFPLLKKQARKWESFKQIYEKQQLSSAIILVDAFQDDAVNFSYHMASVMLCSGSQKSCKNCQSCHLIQLKTHPDLIFLAADKSGIIKIEQIRDLQDLVHISPKLSNTRVVIINGAQNMNLSSSNGLLKLLEEPPHGLTFLLIIERKNTIAKTLLSRCQTWEFLTQTNTDDSYLHLGKNYPAPSGKGHVFAQLGTIIDDLSAIIMYKTTVCEIAEKWSVFELKDLLWLIYLVNSQMIVYQHVVFDKEKVFSDTDNFLADHLKSLFTLSKFFKPQDLFMQLNYINDTLKKLQQNISLNHILSLENLLLGYNR